MEALLERIRLFRNLPYDEIVVEAAMEHEKEITDLNKEQLDKGLDSEGNDLGSYKRFSYKKRYKPVDLKGEGPFRNSFELNAFGDGFEITATDGKTARLMAQYGPAIVGLPKEKLPDAAEMMLDSVLANIRRRTS